VIDENLSRRILATAAIAGASGVLLGAFAAHGLADMLTDRGFDSALVAKRVDQFDVGVRYHLIHAVTLLGLSAVSLGSPNVRRWAARLMLAGMILFSGSLYLLVLTNVPKLGAITPIGGLAWIAGWLCLLLLAKTGPPE
jgi:uncharacterized membrane protein YgdD (TMEM256/DUF423 family)